MTLGEGKRKVYKLIDEYSSGGAVTEDEDIEAKMADFFDIAQKDVAKRQKIVRSVQLPTIDEDGAESWVMPEDFTSVFRIWVNGKISRRNYLFRSNEIVPVGDEKTLEVEYFASPKTIGTDTPDEYEFEVKEDGAQAMCFYVAAQQLFVDLVVDYSMLYQEYLRHLNTLDESVGGMMPNAVINTLWR